MLSDLRREYENQQHDMIFRAVIIKKCANQTAFYHLAWERLKKCKKATESQQFYHGQATFYFSPFCPLL
jgi:hypothetical protein